MKSKKKFVLAGLVLLAIVLLLPLAGCDTNSGSDRGITIQQPGNETGGNNTGSDSGKEDVGSGKPQVTTYTVTFDTNGGSAVASQTVESGQNATKPADPTKDGWTFQG